MRALAVFALCAAVACTAPPRRDAKWERDARALAGEWNARLDFDSTTFTGEPAPRGRMSAGTMSLTVNRTIDESSPRIGVPTDYGTYDIDFTALGRKPSGEGLPGIVVGITANDSVEFVFDSHRAAFSMSMRAPLTTDSIRGRWIAMESRYTVGSGTFLLTRR
jgi:hypothetical protein